MSEPAMIPSVHDSFFSGGKFFVTGGTDLIIRVYVCIPGPPTLQAELTGHTVSRL